MISRNRDNSSELTVRPTAANNVISAKPHQSRTFRIALPSSYRLNALVRKNFMVTFRNIGCGFIFLNFPIEQMSSKYLTVSFIVGWLRIFVLLYFLPAFQATVFNVTLGHEPTGIKMAIVNDELNPSQGRVCNYSTDCSYSMLSCRYLRYIKDNIIQVECCFSFLFVWRLADCKLK